jgi:hypothetical protein
MMIKPQPLTFRQFMQRSSALQLYRSLLRATRPLHGAARAETIKTIRAEFENSRGLNEHDAATSLAMGKDHIARLKTMVAMASGR